MGPLADWEARLDILGELASRGMDSVLDPILGHLTSVDLRQVRLVCRGWAALLERITRHREVTRLGWGWREGEPRLARLQCSKQRSVCTVTSLACDEASIVAGLGSSGRVECWDRRTEARQWAVVAHPEGVYGLALGSRVLVTAGEDGCVRVWARETAAALHTARHHSYIVWAARLRLDQLVTASYDCTVAWLSLAVEESGEVEVRLQHSVQGPWEWADALYLDEAGARLVVQDEAVFSLQVWDTRAAAPLARLAGHTDEVNCVDMRGGLLVSGGCDAVVRLWDWRAGQCVAQLAGHGGKVWSVSCDLHRLVSGGRGGEIRLWRLGPTARRLARGLAAAAEDEEEADTRPGEAETCGEGRALFAHPRSSSVASVALDRFGLVSGDGLALVIAWDFWASQSRACPCKHYTQPVPDPLEL